MSRVRSWPVAVAVAVAAVLAPAAASAQLHTPLPKFKPSGEVIARGAAAGNDAAGLRLFASLATSFSSERAYLASSVVAGYIGKYLFEVSYARVVAADEGDTPDEQKIIRDNVSTVVRLAQNGGAATARLIVPWTPADGAEMAGGVVQVMGLAEAGAVGRSSDDAADDQRGAIGAGVEATATWQVSDKPGGAAIAKVDLGVRGAMHRVMNGRIVDDIRRRNLPLAQAVLFIRQNNTVAFGVTVTAVPKAFRPYVPRAYFSLSADVR